MILVSMIRVVWMMNTRYYTQGFVAIIDDGSCITLAIFGCTQQEFANYDSNANVNQGCEHVFGCMDSAACNYNISASFDDGTCVSLESLPYNNLGVYYDCIICFNDDDLMAYVMN